MQLAAASTFENLVFEDPWPLALTLLVAAAVLAFLAIQRANAKLLRVAGLAVLLAVVIFVVAGLVTTGREQVIANTRQLVGYTAPLQLREFKAMVDPRVVVLIEETAQPEPIAGQEVFDTLEKTVESQPLEGQTILEIDASSRAADEVVCAFNVRTNVRGGGMFITRWVLTWRKQGDGSWKVVEVRWVPVQHMIGIQPSRRYLRG